MHTHTQKIEKIITLPCWRYSLREAVFTTFWKFNPTVNTFEFLSSVSSQVKAFWMFLQSKIFSH